MIYINNPVDQTWIFSSLLGLALLLSIRKKTHNQLFPVSVTQELKGLAILLIIFAHIGYDLSADPRFLWPLSNLAGVGVNLFLFMSGYGLTSSNLRRKLSIRQFYNRRLKKLYLPFWLTVSFFLLLDFFVLHRSYPADYIYKTFLGIFQSADITKDLDSPLWYFTLIAFYYLIYPLVFMKKRPWLSALIIFSCTYILLHHSFVESMDTLRFYKVYTVAFPLGIIAAWLHHIRDELRTRISTATGHINKFIKIKPATRIYQSKLVKDTLYYFLILSLLLAVVYSRSYASPWDSPQKEQAVNVLTMLAIVVFFVLSRVEMKLFYLFGVYSYEIYLLHWPLMSRYNIFFGRTYAWLATVLYLVTLLILGLVLSRLPDLFVKYIKKIVTK